jgi:hypothetical protein
VRAERKRQERGGTRIMRGKLNERERGKEEEGDRSTEDGQG